ncbi:MAG: YkgJ family cysteine cluster protein [Methanosarcinaceae archaeon]|nr:YkgJ family cysteine cluster protein [Methanosarcinaceae archaeon]
MIHTNTPELNNIKRSLIEMRLVETKNELEGMIAYPDDKLIDIIKDVGFECDLCGRCCTNEFNDHVFLLDKDTALLKKINPSALTPAPYYEFCDQNGRFYVSGYALKIKPDGSCIFLTNGRCEIYDSRLSICRLYPYMLHYEADEDGNLEWRQISGLNEHGNYHTDIDDDDCKKIAADIKEYEAGYLNQQISFLNAIDKLFKKEGLRHVQGVYDREMRRFKKGGKIEVFVFFDGDFESVKLA